MPPGRRSDFWQLSRTLCGLGTWSSPERQVKHGEAELFGERHGKGLSGFRERRSGGEDLSLVLLDIRIPSPVGFLLENEEIAVLKDMGRLESALPLTITTS